VGLLSYIFLLYLNSSFFTKFVLVIFILLFVYILILIILKYRIMYIYKSELSNFLKKFDDSHIDFKNIYNKLLKDKNRIGASSIFFSGFSEFIYLHKSGVSDVVIISHVLKHAMRAKALIEIEKLKNNLYLFLLINYVIIFLSILYFILGFFIFLYKINFNLYQDLSFSIILSGLNEFIFQLFIGLLIAFPFRIVYYKYLDLVDQIFNNYCIFIDKFMILLYHKLYD